MRNRLDKFCYSQDWKAGAPKVSIPEVSRCQRQSTYRGGWESIFPGSGRLVGNPSLVGRVRFARYTGAIAITSHNVWSAARLQGEIVGRSTVCANVSGL
jgi:hypothetical protein